MASRSEVLSQTDAATYDLCVIGGGASGAGCALDAQLRGLRTILVEGADFASRTSSASTKMAHGGIRYLQAAFAQMDFRQFRLVSHAVRERALMLRNAPHLAATQEFLVPCYTRGQQLYYGAGLKIYDRIAGRAGLARSRILSSATALRRLPALGRRELLGAVSYADGQFDDARYGLALILTFVRAGGTAINYARAVDFERASSGRITALAVEDSLTRRTFTIRARAFVNATGPYSDALRRLASPDAATRLRPSKGVHLMFPLDSDWNSDGLVVPKTEDGRVVFAFPYNGRLLVGTTDTAASPDAEMVVTGQEIDYLIRQINPYLERPLRAAGMVSGFAGIRPLVESSSSTDTARLIRDDEVEVDSRSGLISILGGKWTTYRLMAERTIDRVQSALGVPAGGCVTRTTPLAGSEEYHAALWRELMLQYHLPELTARHLARKFGSSAKCVLRLAEERGELSAPLVGGAPPLQAEVIYSVRHEMAVTVDDILARRTGLELYDWRLAIEAAPVVARLMAAELGWNPPETGRAADQYIAIVRRLMQAASR